MQPPHDISLGHPYFWNAGLHDQLLCAHQLHGYCKICVGGSWPGQGVARGHGICFPLRVCAGANAVGLRLGPMGQPQGHWPGGFLDSDDAVGIRNQRQL